MKNILDLIGQKPNCVMRSVWQSILVGINYESMSQYIKPKIFFGTYNSRLIITSYKYIVN